MFSPYYAWQRRRGPADPLRHCTLNVALYGLARGWAMTERGGADRSADHLAIGPSSLRWDRGVLTIDVHERMAPLGARLRGQIRVHPVAMTGRTFMLDPTGRHRWSPLAPRATVEVELRHPALRWSGPGYLDHNAGTAPLEQDFLGWTWSRSGLGARTAILYDVTPLAAPPHGLSLLIEADGSVADMPAPPKLRLPATRWRVPRETRSDGPAAVRSTLEDAPFYARSIIESTLLGQRATGMHESLSLSRFRSPVVQLMLPFRMPRRGGAPALG